MSEKLRRVADFEWARVAQYLVWLSVRVNLHEINSDHVYSFKVGASGARGILRRKERVLEKIRLNMAALERFVGEHSDALGTTEMSVIRSQYRQLKSWQELVTIHCSTARTLVGNDGGAKDDLF